MIEHTDTSEKAFQKLIVKTLVQENGFIESSSNDFDREFCFNKEQLTEFLKATQLAAYNPVFRYATPEKFFIIILYNSAC
jgi:type I restriction enzyme, R subunit